jgi:hypothetical protein
MKYSIIFFLCAFAVSARAQITLEHTYNIGTGLDSISEISLVEIDSGSWKYVGYTHIYSPDTVEYFTIYNLDHSLERVIRLYQSFPASMVQAMELPVPIAISKNLFDLSGKYAYLFRFPYFRQDRTQQTALRVIREDSTILFSCDSCELYNGGLSRSPSDGIFATDSGVKMMVNNSIANGKHVIDVYSLPGKLPGCPTSTLGVSDPPSVAGNNPSLPTSAYPNPSNGRVRITYELPLGVSSGEIVLLTEDGKEVKRYMVTNAFSDLLIEAPELPSGSYFYKLVTEKGESATKRIVWLK